MRRFAAARADNRTRGCDHYVRNQGDAPPQGFAYYRDWVFQATNDMAEAYATAPSYPVGKERTYYLSGSSTPGTDGALVTNRKQVTPGSSTYSNDGPIGRPVTRTGAFAASSQTHQLELSRGTFEMLATYAGVMPRRKRSASICTRFAETWSLGSSSKRC